MTLRCLLNLCRFNKWNRDFEFALYIQTFLFTVAITSYVQILVANDIPLRVIFVVMTERQCQIYHRRLDVRF